MHVSIFDLNSKIVLEECNKCCNRLFHCPICPNFDPTVKERIEKHMNHHISHGLPYKDKILLRCSLHCRPQGHFHCPICSRTVMRRLDMKRHLLLCEGFMEKDPSPKPSLLPATSPKDHLIKLLSSPSVKPLLQVVPPLKKPLLQGLPSSVEPLLQVIPPSKKPLLQSLPSSVEPLLQVIPPSKNPLLQGLPSSVEPLLQVIPPSKNPLLQGLPSSVEPLLPNAAPTLKPFLTDTAPGPVSDPQPSTSSVEHSYSQASEPDVTMGYGNAVKCPHCNNNIYLLMFNKPPTFNINN